MIFFRFKQILRLKDLINNLFNEIKCNQSVNLSICLFDYQSVQRNESYQSKQIVQSDQSDQSGQSDQSDQEELSVCLFVCLSVCL